MSWTDIFRSRYVRSLESELAAIRQRHADEIEALKKTHAEERERCINETNRAWGEVDRLRQYLLPGMPVADRSTPTATTDNSKPAEFDPTQHGTPWQKLQAKYAKQQAEEERLEKEAKKAQAASPVPPA